MKTAMDLLVLGNRISKDYVEHNTDMSESLEKIAAEHGLNAQEISRVAEQANVETYLALLSKSKDHYVEFPLANASTVYEKVAGLQKTAEVEEEVSDRDYEDLLAPSHRLESFEKVAEQIESVEEEPSPNIRGLMDYAEFLNNELSVYQAKLANALSSLYKLEKQALFHNSPEELSHVINSISPDVMELVEKEHYPTLATHFYEYDFTKRAEFPDTEIEESELTKAIEKVAEQVDCVKILLQEELNTIDKLASAGTLLKGLIKHIVKGTKRSANFFKQYPRISTGIVVGGTAIPLSYKAGKDYQKTKSNPMSAQQQALVEEILKQRSMRLI